MNEDFPTLLKTYRKSMGWTQEELAQQWSYSFETISAWERGKRTPSNQEIPRLAKFLEMESDLVAALIVEGRERSNPLKKAIETRSGWKASFETWGELQKIYRTRTEFNTDFSYAHMFEHAQTIFAAGISLNAIALTYSRDALLQSIVEDHCRVQLCFLDPNGKRCAEREEEESYPSRTLSDLTSVNILLMKTLRNLIEKTHPEQCQHLDIRTYDLTPRFNIYIVDDSVMTVQNYAYGRGEDTPTLLLKRKMRGGLFDFYAAAAQHILEHATSVIENIVPSP
jgi:transcriptional regulator with XRE-family HTH domain